MSLAGMGFDSKCDFCPSYHLAGASPLPFDMGYLLKVAPAQLLILTYHFIPSLLLQLELL